MAEEAYNIVQSVEKKYDICTYIDVINALISEHPEKAIQLGEKILMLYSSQENTEVIQYVYALMGKASYLLNDGNALATYLRKIDISQLSGSTYFYQAIEEIEAGIPLSKVYSEEGGCDWNDR